MSGLSVVPTTDDGSQARRGGFAAAAAALLTSSATLVCCALPAMLVALGAGAVLSSLVAAVPQLVWLSEHKAAVFGIAAAMLALAGVLQWRARSAPCPIDPALRDACLRIRKLSARVYLASVALFLGGGWFAFIQPALA
ncbi:hypothetical protein [Rivibacter subsaxonicus]|uniref:Mercuric transport protein MerT n=1 Tax=Rivibacter subsaxonicus TaxID=457575 RepID=A0A4V2FSN6_9BURK|nr:hypothetical protein [Rivibacter subsaxonicus]RZT94985.1 hypothetical protein EV670_2731 [Rivibacter subsaxonicus]